MTWGVGERGVGTGAAEAPVLTVLFTDIEGSTSLVERLGDRAWVEVLDDHDAVVRLALARHGGREVKTVGDGFMAVFSTAAAGVRCAVEIQRLMAGVGVPETRGGLRVRIGAHVGPVVLRGDDVLGRNVNVARRIATVARGGQTLVSSHVKVLAERAGGLLFGQAATVRLKGLSEPQVLFAVAGERARATVHHLEDTRRSRHALVGGIV